MITGLGRQRQQDPWYPLASWSNIISDFQKDFVSKISILGDLLNPSNASQVACSHAPTHEYKCTKNLAGKRSLFSPFSVCLVFTPLSHGTRAHATPPLSSTLTLSPAQNRFLELEPCCSSFLLCWPWTLSWKHRRSTARSGRTNENLSLALISEMEDQAHISSFFFDFNWAFSLLFACL